MGTLQELGLALLAILMALGALWTAPREPAPAATLDCLRPAEVASQGRVLLVCLEREGEWRRTAEQLSGDCPVPEPGTGRRATILGGCRAEVDDMPGAHRLLLGLKLDLNRAGEEDLQELPGIGPALARRIVELRKERGPFSDPEQLLEVPGIGPKRLENLRPFIETGADAP